METLNEGQKTKSKQSGGVLQKKIDKILRNDLENDRVSN